MIWALALAALLVGDVATPSLGAFQPFGGQSLEIARRVVQAASASLPPSLQPRLPVSVQQAPRSMVHADVRRQAVSSRPFVVPLVRSPQVEAEASSTSVDPA